MLKETQDCIQFIQKSPRNCVSSLELIKLIGAQHESSIGGKWARVERELKSIANRAEIVDSPDEPNRNHPGRLLRRSYEGYWSYDPT